MRKRMRLSTRMTTSGIKRMKVSTTKLRIKRMTWKLKRTRC